MCELTTKDGTLCGEQFPSKTALRAHQLWSSSLGGGHWLGGAPLAVVRSNERSRCRAPFSSVGAARQHMRETYEMGHCRVDGWTHRWPHVMKGEASRCPLCDWTGSAWEDCRKHAINSHSPPPAPAPLPQRRSRVNAVFVASIRRREHGAKVGAADNLRLESTSAKETKTSHTSRQAPALEAVARVQKKRAGHQNLVRRRVRHHHRLKPAERSGCGKGTNPGLQRRSTPLIWAWVGLGQGLITEGTKLGVVLAPVSDHMEELNELSIEERCGMVKHCGIDKTFQPQQCRLTHAVETLRLRHAVEKALEAL